ncbi:hypothetical protein RZS08_41675, partial [Arthrospira platensis SPKY1]|nr:hypothetical protein [Arthrospira platensis SPKY1]
TAAARANAGDVEPLQPCEFGLGGHPGPVDLQRGRDERQAGGFGGVVLAAQYRVGEAFELGRLHDAEFVENRLQACWSGAFHVAYDRAQMFAPDRIAAPATGRDSGHRMFRGLLAGIGVG